MNTDTARRQMIDQQVRAWHVSDPAVLETLGDLARDQFVPPAYRHLAYADTEIPLAHGQSMMTPVVEGNLLQALKLGAGDRVLEIGSGSGYLTACLARLAGSVTSIDIIEDFVGSAQTRLDEAGIVTASLACMDATVELPAGPFDAIAVTASMPRLEEWLLQALAPGGRLFVVVGDPPVMEAQLITRNDDGAMQVDSLFETNIAPLVNVAATPEFRF